MFSATSERLYRLATRTGPYDGRFILIGDVPPTWPLVASLRRYRWPHRCRRTAVVAFGLVVLCALALSVFGGIDTASLPFFLSWIPTLTTRQPAIVRVTVAQVEREGFPLPSDRTPCYAVPDTIYRVHNSSKRFSPYKEWPSPSPPLSRSANVSARLDAWLAAPVGTYDTWREFNLLSCGNPSVRRERNQLHVRQNADFWSGISARDVVTKRQELADVLRKAEREGRFDEWQRPDRSGTRGIVWTAGNADTFDRVLVSLRLLRNAYNSTLSAQVYHFPDENPTEDQRREFADLQATVAPLVSLSKGPLNGRTKSFHLKGAALVECEFDEVLMLDSDNVPARDVDFLFDSLEFKEMGAVFWPDYWKDQPENAIWALLGVQCRDEFTIEAGQVLVKKSQHLDALLLLEHMLEDWQYWFQLSDGDKDLFRYAFLALRKRWAVPTRHLSPVSWMDRSALGGDKYDRFAGHSMLQYGLTSEADGTAGRPLFVHTNLLKRITADLHNGNTFGRTLRLNLTLPASRPVSSASDFVFHCDYLVNVSPLTGIGLPPADLPGHHAPPPLWVRQRALLSRGLGTYFFDGHLFAAYVLAIENGWQDEMSSLVEGAALEDAMSERERDQWRRSVERERRRRCAANLRITSGLDTVEVASARMEVALWEHDADLAGFEDRFYSIGGGRAGGHGF